MAPHHRRPLWAIEWQGASGRVETDRSQSLAGRHPATHIRSMNPPDSLISALADRYTIERELGEGGMATVYLATDLKHNRQVAIKVLKEDLAAVVGEERFLAEIETTAQLQHPHILPLFDSGAADGFLFYAMPYVEGETLRDRLKREVQLPVEQAIELVQKIAAALDYAHEKGIVHRDIKPENILLSSGEPLISDFGIALAVSQANDGRRTETGISLGTPYYMSPEQAAGDRSLDPRSDIYALGCVLQELLTGEPPFSGANAQAVLARILTTRPTPVTSLRPTVPLHVESAINKALEKLPADRFTSAKEFRTALSNPDFRHTVVERTMGSTAVPTQTRIVREGVKTPVVAAIGGAALVTGLIAGVMVIGSDRQPSTAGERVTRSTVELPSSYRDGSSRELVVELSPDGRHIVVGPARGQNPELSIQVRSIEDTEFRPIPGTEGGSAPSFSPDGQAIAFTDLETGRLLVVNLDGGELRTIVNTSDIRPFYPHWGTDDRIVFTGNAGVNVASATTAATEDIVRLESAGQPSDPYLLPGGQAVLATDDQSGDGIWYYPLDRDTAWAVTETGSFPSYLPSGELIYTTDDGGLFAVAFDPDRGETSGSPVRLLDGTHTERSTRGYRLTNSGDLIQTLGPASSGLGGRNGPLMRYVRVDSSGTPDTLPLLPKFRNYTRISPDGRYLVYLTSGDGDNPQVHTYDLLENDEEQLTFEGSYTWPIWSPDGEWLVFTANADGRWGSFWIARADGAAEPRLLHSVESGEIFASDWTPDDELIYDCVSEGDDVCRGRLVREGDSWTLTPDERPYLAGEWYDGAASLAPQGDLLAHESDLGSPEDEIYVSTWPEITALPRRGTNRTSGGIYPPRWSPDGTILYYGTSGGAGADSIFRIVVERDPAVLRDPEFVFAGLDLRGFDVFPDGKLLLNAYADEAAPSPEGSGQSDDDTSIRYFLVMNWRAEMERKLAEARR
jgi:serine/threonine-protein kinase